MEFLSTNYIIGSSVSSIAPGDRGETWCTVQNSGVFCFDASGKIIAHPQSPAGTCIIYKDKRGSYWISNSSALYSYNPYTGAYQQKISFTSAGIYCMTDDNQGNLYISVYSKGLYIYNVETGNVKILNMSTRGKKVTSATTGFAVWLLTTPDIYGLVQPTVYPASTRRHSASRISDGTIS